MVNMFGCKLKNPLNERKKVRNDGAYNPTRLCAILLANLSGGVAL